MAENRLLKDQDRELRNKERAKALSADTSSARHKANELSEKIEKKTETVKEIWKKENEYAKCIHDLKKQD